MDFTFKEKLIIKSYFIGIPSTVVEATAEYREEEDEIGEFISEMCFDYGRCDRKLLTKKALVAFCPRGKE